jgi:DNA-binding NarL/FixJ family response regulator
MRCLIVDDSHTFRCAALDLLERAGIAVVGVASNSADGLRYYRDLRPDVTLVDVDLGDESGFDLVEQLYASGVPQPSPVILISAHAEQDLAEMIADSAAVGFLSKLELSPEAILELVHGHGIRDQAGARPVSGPPET